VHTARLYLPQHLAPGKILGLGDQATHHVMHVLRLRPGAMLRVFDGKGREHEALLRETGRARATVEVGGAAASIPEPPLAITLAQGIPRGDRMDLILQKAVELGVDCVQPLWMSRSQARPARDRMEKRMRHWRGIIISACEQCGRATLPSLAPATEYRTWLDGEHRHNRRVLLDPQAQQSLGEMPRPATGDSIVLLVGPEGGISTEEAVLAAAEGFVGLRLGPRILRTETAALAMLAALQALWGDLQ
jgi:16S rRNA (uracil1498-N3)-methyltransferase